MHKEILKNVLYAKKERKKLKTNFKATPLRKVPKSK